MKNYNNKEVRLVCASTGAEKKIGDEVRNFRGDLATIKSMRPPHKESSAGYVNNFYASVYNCKYVEL